MTYYTVDHDIRYWVSDNTFDCYFSMYLWYVLWICSNDNIVSKQINFKLNTYKHLS